VRDLLALGANECQNYTGAGHAAQGPSHRAARFRRILLALAGIAAVSAVGLPCRPARAQPESAVPEPVRRALQRAGVPLSNVAVLVHELGRPEPAVAWRTEETMSPASVMKLITTYSALDLLGPAYTWKTEFFATDRDDGEGAGDLYIRGYGDPLLTLPRFQAALADLRQRGLRDIRGDLVLDESWFAPQAADPAAFDGQPDRAYNIPPRALMVGLKATAIRLVPTPGRDRPRLTKSPEVPEIVVIDDVEQVAGPCPADWSAGLERSVAAAGGSATVRLSGRYPAECGERTLYLNVLDNPAYVLAVFRRFWTALGGQGPARVRSGTVAPGAAPLLSIQSPSLAEAIRETNKQSSNIMARQILLTLAAERNGPPGNERAAAEVVRRWLGSRGLSFPELRLENGSGLSRLERVTAAHLGELLRLAARGPWMPELAASLPIAAYDGTLERRLKGSAAAGQARLKTGSIDGVKSIAGYVLDRSGHWVVVVFLVNHPEAAATGPAQDALVEWTWSRAR
jgi:serine-type D-Ala-D-Ala carboxypeptidase/endopeptidase (penicillin-binding protein 4)